MRVLVLTRYGSMGASSRMRFLQYLPWLDSASWTYDVEPFFTDGDLATRYRVGSYGRSTLVGSYCRRILRMTRRHRYDLLWIEKEALPWFPVSVERWLLRGVPYVLDFDDAVYHNYDRHRFSIVRNVLGRRLDYLMSGARLVIAGNNYLMERAASAGAPWVVKLPTAVELSRYVMGTPRSLSKPTIVWIGSPTTVRYLTGLESAFAALAKRMSYTLRVIGGGPVHMPGVDLEIVAWSAETEAAAIAECDVGVMPLEDSPWERGKCAYKLIQYMACGLPTVASPVGANLDVVTEGETGYFAEDEDNWINRLEYLLRNPDVRKRLGENGRERVEAEYCVERTAPKLIEFLSTASERNSKVKV